MHLVDEPFACVAYALVRLVADYPDAGLAIGVALNDLLQYRDAAVGGAVVAEDIVYVLIRLAKERLGTLGYVLLHAIDGYEDGDAHVVYSFTYSVCMVVRAKRRSAKERACVMSEALSAVGRTS